jgi:hypothetical protein
VNYVPRPRLIASAPQLSAGQAAYVLERLIAERRISAAEVNRCVGDMHREISALESRLQMLRTSAGAPATSARRGPGRPPGSGRRPGRPPGSGRKAAAPAAPAAPSAPAAIVAPRKRRRRSRITAEQLASRQLQGRYLGLIRQIPASKRGQFQKIAKDRGREAAINEMRSVLKK